MLHKEIVEALCKGQYNITKRKCPKFGNTCTENQTCIARWDRVGYEYLEGEGQVKIKGSYCAEYNVFVSPPTGREVVG